jgi:hypothetical protein
MRRRQTSRTCAWRDIVPRACAFVGLAVLAGSLPAAAADEGAVPAGSRVRVSTPKGRLVGRFVGRQEMTILLARETDGRTDTLDIPLSDVSRLEVSQGRGGRGRSAMIGALAGLGAAVAIGLVAGEDCSSGGDLCFDHGTVILGSAALAVPLGALVGFAIPPGEKWGPAPAGGLSVRPQAARGGGMGVRVAIAF